MGNRDVFECFLDYFLIEEKGVYMPLLKKACAAWNIREEELQNVIQVRMQQYHRTDHQAMRKVLALYLKEWLYIEALKENSEQMKIYFNVPGAMCAMYWIKQSLDCNAYLGTPDLITMVVLYGILGRKTKMETNGCRHCAVNVMRLLLRTEQQIPEPDIRCTFGLVCDEAPKQDLLIEMTESETTHFYIHSPVRGRDEKLYLERQVEDMIKKIATKYHVLFDEKEYWKIKNVRFNLSAKIDQIIQFISRSKSFLLSNADIGLLETLLLASFQTDMNEIVLMLDDLYHEIRHTSGKEIKYKFCIYYTPVCNPQYGRIMEENGIALLYQTAFVSNAVYTGSYRVTEDIAAECCGMIITKSVYEEADKISDVICRRRFDGLLLGMFTFDRWMGAQQNLLKTLVEKKTGKRVYIYETDFWNQEIFSPERMYAMVETWTEMLEEEKSETRSIITDRKPVPGMPAEAAGPIYRRKR